MRPMTSPTTAPIMPTEAAPMTAHGPGSGRPRSRTAIVFTAYSPRPRQTWRGSGCRSAIGGRLRSDSVQRESGHIIGDDGGVEHLSGHHDLSHPEASVEQQIG